MKLNLKGWKKVHDEETHSVLRSPHGHEIKISKKPLSPELREQLSQIPCMADGGKVPATQASSSPPEPDPKKAKEIQDSSQKSGVDYLKAGWDNAKKELGFADGGAVSSAQDSPDQIAQDAAAQQPNPIVEAIKAGAQPAAPQPSGAQQFGQQLGQRIANSPPVLAGKALAGAASQVIPAVAGGIQGLASGISGRPIAQPASPQGAPEQVPPPVSMGSAGAPQQAPQDPSAPDNSYEGIMKSGYDQQIAGINAKQAADSNLGRQGAQVSALQATQDALNARNQQESIEKGEAAYQQFNDAVKAGEIDPQRFWHEKSTFGKVMTGLGILVAGGGAGVLGQSNAALDYLNAQVNRDIDAQKKNLDSRQSLLAHNMEHFRNMQDAEAVTRAQYNAMYGHMLDKVVNNNKSEQAKATALDLKGKLAQSNAFILSGLGKSPTGAGTGGAQEPQDVDSIAQNYLQRMRPIDSKKAEEFESRYVPNVGIAQIPVPAATRDKITGKQTLDARARDLYSWAAKHSGSVDPATVAQGKTKAAELQSMYRQAIEGGVFKKGEQEFIDNIVDSDPTKFFNSVRVLPKLKEVINSNGAQLDTLKKSYRIQGHTAASGSQPSSNISFTPVKGK